MIAISVEQFEALVADALDTIPADLRTAMDNVAVLVDDTAAPGPLLGLYEGVPLTERGHYSAAMPDRITIYMATICAQCRNAQEVVDLVRTTVVHEVGHHFGLKEERLRDLGWA